MRHRGPGPARRHRARAPEERSLTDPAGPRFLGSFPSADVALEPPHPEVVLLGRSNVGKSSLLNALLGRKLAHVSATPGKTRMLNAYEVRGAWPVGGAGTGKDRAPRAEPHAFYLLDLPGYGWSRAGREERAAFRGLVTRTLDRERVAGVLWLLDIRHDPSEDDRATQDLLAGAALPVLAALTKSDKLPGRQRAERTAALRDTLGLDDAQLLVTSARTKDGIQDLRDTVTELVRKAEG